MTLRYQVPRWVAYSLGCALCGWLAWSATTAHAQATSADSKAAAEALFDEGLALLQKGDFANACVKLEQSQLIDHGIGTMLYLAECYEKSGRTASAWALFRQAASEAAAAGESERASTGKRRADRLTPLLSKLTINVAPPAAAGLEITRNDAPVPNVLWGVATPVDPGEQRIAARANGYAPWSASVLVSNKPGESASLLVPALTPVVASTAVAPSAAPASPLRDKPAPAAAPAAASNAALAVNAAPPANQATRGSTQRTVGIVIGAVGIAAVAVGSVFGLRAISKENDAEKHCPKGGAACIDSQGVSLTESAQSAARLSNIFMIGGAVLAAAGVVVYVVAPRSEQPTVGLSADGHAVRATFGGVF